MFITIQINIDFYSEFMFILLCELSIVLEYDEMNYDFFWEFFTMYSEKQIRVGYNHESIVLMNGSVRYVKN